MFSYAVVVWLYTAIGSYLPKSVAKVGVLCAVLLWPSRSEGVVAEHAQHDDAELLEFFEKRIRPVLIDHCYECHSGQAKKLQGGLRLDFREGLRRGGESGSTITPGKPDESLLVSALRHQSLEMPPGKKLSPQIIRDFERWIRQGAVDPREKPSGASAGSTRAPSRHWAFQPLRRPRLPVVSDVHQTRSSMDSFVVARLAEGGLRLSPPADRVTLIRRVYFDLLGFPPSPQAVDRFVNDPSPHAFARLVDRLLASPHYGERWGRFWLDVARYADNKGYVFFEEKKYPWAWTYRDYVTAALNADLPFDRFVLEQIAADQLDLGADRRSLAAMGFLTLGARFMNNTHDIIDDRIDVVTRGLMGLTVTCARCHNHKYDPIQQADYYGLYGVFRSSVEPILPPDLRHLTLTPTVQEQAYQKFQAGMKERLEKLDKFVAAQREQIIQGARRRLGEYLLAVYRKRRHPSTESFMLLTEKGALIPAMIHRWEAYLNRARRRNDPVWTLWHQFSELPLEEFKQAAGRILKEVSNERFPEKVHPQVRAAFQTNPPRSMEDVAKRYGELFAQVDEQSRQGKQVDPALWQVLYGAKAPPMIPRELSWGFLDLLPDRPTQAEYQKLRKEVETWSTKQPAAPPRAMVLIDAETPYDSVVFIRGNPHREGGLAPRGFPRFLCQPNEGGFSRGSGRLELAQRIVDPNNPLTARVLVNRVWKWHFGRGLVDTPSDFGLRAGEPSHPRLLDWLASEFMHRGWSIKHLQRTILNSAVYQQSSCCACPATTFDNQREAAAVDPQNRRLWRFPRRRLDFEAMRDSLLAVAGSLDQRIGGPPVEMINKISPRRTIYGFVNRMDLPPLMRAFDFPEPAATSPQREQTTVAPQALFFLNGDFVSRCAKGVAKRADVASISDPIAQIQKVYQVLFSRSPDQEELALAKAYLQSNGRMEDYVHALLMTNEFLFVD